LAGAVAETRAKILALPPSAESCQLEGRIWPD
jgi:hypothetical protein